jgi:hypothetical protein
VATEAESLTDGKLMLLVQPFYLNRDKNNYFYTLQAYPWSACSWVYLKEDPLHNFFIEFLLHFAPSCILLCNGVSKSFRFAQWVILTYIPQLLLFVPFSCSSLSLAKKPAKPDWPTHPNSLKIKREILRGTQKLLLLKSPDSLLGPTN